MVQRNHRAKRYCHGVWNILLARTEYPKKHSPHSRAVRHFPIPSKESGRSCVGENTETTVTLLDTTTGNQTQVFSTTNFFSQQRHSKSALRWSPKDVTNFLLSHLSRNTRRTHFPRSNRHPCSNGHKGYCARSKSLRGTMEFKCQYTLLSRKQSSSPPSQYTTPGNIALRQRGIVRHRRQYLIVLEPKTGILYQFSTEAL